jgi:hypothetical protein
VAVVSALAGDDELAAGLEEIGGQRFLDALGELFEDYDDDATYVIDDMYDDDPETVGGEEVWIWTLIGLHRNRVRSVRRSRPSSGLPGARNGR